MASQRKIFKRVGIRRDKNFSDLGDNRIALNNLLDTLIDDLDATFISEDLNAIRGLFSTGIQPTEYRNFANSRVVETNSAGVNLAVFPRISYQNRLDKFEVSAGRPRLNGGDGLTANYYNEDQVQNTQAVFTGVTTGPQIPSDTFWEAGDFQYTGKIHPQSVNAAGGVQWDGFFIPTQTGPYTFTSASTLGLTADFEAEGYTSGINTFTEYTRIGLTTTITSNTSGGDANQILIPIANAKHVGIGMTANGTGLRAGENKITGLSRGTTEATITLENADGDVVTTGSGSVSIVYSRAAGASASSIFTTQVLEKYRRYRIRYRFFVPPGVNTRGINKGATFFYQPPSAQSGTYLRYNNLYSLDYDFTNDAKGDFNNFLDQSVFFGGGLIGGSTSNNYVRVSSTKKVDVKYTPKKNLAAITKSSTTMSWSAGSPIIACSNTTNIEVGNYLFAANLTANIDTPIRVEQVLINRYLIVDTAPTGTSTGSTVEVIDHRGFVKRVSTTGSGGNISGTIDGLKSGMVVIAGGSTEDYIGITTSGQGGAVPVSYFPTNQSLNSPLYFYESRGLIDKALKTFCPPATTRCVLVTQAANIGDTTLTVKDTTGLTGNDTMVIQGFNFAKDPNNPLIDITTISQVNAQNNTITLSQGIVKAINPDSNFTATSSGSQKDLCCPPTDTSPPFNPTEEGLESTGPQPNIEITGGNVVFDELRANVAAVQISDYNNGETSQNVLQLKGGDGATYELLCV